MSITETLVRSPLAQALASPHGVDRYLETWDPMWAARDVRARITDIRTETDVPGAPPVATLTLTPTRTWRGHRAGQYVQLGVELPGARRTTRCFTVASHDSKPGEPIEVTMRANPDGVVSRHLVGEPGDRPALGQVVHLSQAQGEFTLPDRVPERLLLISGGSGITPVMSMLRSLQRRTHRGRVTFLHYAQSPDHQIFADELDAVSRSGWGVDVHRFYPEAGDRAFSPAELERLVPGFRDVDTYACGPAGLIERVQRAYDVPEGQTGTDRLRVEYFKPPRTGGGSGGGDISFARSGTSAPNDGSVLLEQAEAAGLTPEYGCRMGICFSCTARKHDGTVRNVLTGETSSLPGEDIRVCVSAADGDCSVDL